MRTQTCAPPAVGGTNRQYEKLTVNCLPAVPEGETQCLSSFRTNTVPALTSYSSRKQLCKKPPLDQTKPIFHTRIRKHMKWREFPEPILSVYVLGVVNRFIFYQWVVIIPRHFKKCGVLCHTLSSKICVPVSIRPSVRLSVCPSVRQRFVSTLCQMHFSTIFLQTWYKS